VGTSTFDNLIGLHGLCQGEFYFLLLIFTFLARYSLLLPLCVYRAVTSYNCIILISIFRVKEQADLETSVKEVPPLAACSSKHRLHLSDHKALNPEVKIRHNPRCEYVNPRHLRHLLLVLVLDRLLCFLWRIRDEWFKNWENSFRLICLHVIIRDPFNGF
jgi:hypothetical protein